MKKFIHEENMKLFREQLAETTDPKKRQMLLKLLAEEEAKEDKQPRLSLDTDQCNWGDGHATMSGWRTSLFDVPALA
jgi:hypothetical protein